MDAIGQIDTQDFRPETLDKVERLLDLLEEIGRHPDLKGKLSLHGGTAINLFMLDVPRLSVDIDISYVGAIAKEAMLVERPHIERGIIEVARAQGYSVTPSGGDHAGRTFKLQYRGDWGPDHVKIDTIYMNRSPLLPLQLRSNIIRPSLKVLLFADSELIGGKVKALFDRVKVRDLYDIANLKTLLESSAYSKHEMTLTHQIILFHASISAWFPSSFAGRAKDRFSDRQRELEEQLYPMLRKTSELPTLQYLIEEVDAFIDEYVLPRNTTEELYLARLDQGLFEPELLFGEGPVAEAASKSPEAIWKLVNLNKR